MLRRLATAVLLGACLTSAVAQVRFEPERRRLTAHELALEARRSPTTAQDVRQRFVQLMVFARSNGGPARLFGPAPVRRAGMLLDQNRLEEAAPIVDRMLRSLEERKNATLTELAGTLSPSEAVAPALLSTPELASPRLAQSAAGVELPQLGRAELAVQAPARTEETMPWRLILAAVGLLLLTAGMIPLAVAWKERLKGHPPSKPERPFSEKYAIEGLISSGGMGEVYEGRDLLLGRRVALKKMLPDLKLDAAMRKQFLQEARTVAKLTHPYIVQIHDCLENGEDVYLVFEFVKGKTLAQILTEKPRLTLKECLRIFEHVCPAVDYAHKSHVLHRDLKPANIMVDEHGIARVMDFGIALESTRTVTMSSPGVLDASGTLRYMPPEQHHGKSVRASDIYAMGICLYEMTTGSLPFSASSVDELIAQKRARRFAPPSSLVPSLPKDLDLFVASVLAPDPKDRMGSSMEFLELLTQLAA